MMFKRKEVRQGNNVQFALYIARLWEIFTTHSWKNKKKNRKRKYKITSFYDEMSFSTRLATNCTI